MATLRKGKCYRNIVRPYTRRSKKKKKSFIKSVPNSRIARFNTGDTRRKFESKLVLKTKEAVQIRHNAIESTRVLINRHLSTNLGPKEYLLTVVAFPHHVLRENKMLTGAHADRLQTGMAHAFGKTVGLAAQMKKGSVLFAVSVDKKNVDLATKSMKRASPRLPAKVEVEVVS
tara:strand:- start:6494 stop:7012 length:519 start_codon:yes stop_codon:yes gene_type:complete